MAAKPRLADVQCTRMQFVPGDRILVKLHQTLSKTEAKRLQKTIEKWAGDHVEVLIVDLTKMELSFERADQRTDRVHSR